MLSSVLTLLKKPFCRIIEELSIQQVYKERMIMQPNPNKPGLYIRPYSYFTPFGKDEDLGLSTRDYFAAKAMEGLVSAQKRAMEGLVSAQKRAMEGLVSSAHQKDAQEIAIKAYAIANAMIAEREKNNA
jgi:hypothetical protein